MQDDIFEGCMRILGLVFMSNGEQPDEHVIVGRKGGGGAPASLPAVTQCYRLCESCWRWRTKPGVPCHPGWQLCLGCNDSPSCRHAVHCDLPSPHQRKLSRYILLRTNLRFLLLYRQALHPCWHFLRCRLAVVLLKKGKHLGTPLLSSLEGLAKA